MSSDLCASDVEIERVACRLLDCTLPKAEWTHAAHLAAALWLLRNRLDLVLSRDLPAIIRRYNEAVGGVNTDTEGYHETITQASLHAAQAFLASRPYDEPLHQTLEALLASPLGRPEWMLAHWSKARLFSVEARRKWCEPDIEPL